MVLVSLNPAIRSGQQVTVIYTVPGDTTTALQDAAGNIVLSFTLNPEQVKNNSNVPARSTTQEEASPLTARFETVPAAHDGETPFVFELRFSEEIEGLSYKTVRDHVLAVTGGRVTGARRLARPSNQRWEITVAPESGAEVTMALPPGRACGETGAVCTADGRALAAGVAAIVPGPVRQSPEPAVTPLTARFLAVPAEHDGETSFTFELRFSEEIAIGYKTVRDNVLAVTGATVTGARRLARPGNRRWEIAVAPDGPGDVGVRLAPTADCAAPGAVCTTGGKKLTSALGAPWCPARRRSVGGRRRGDGGTGREPRLRGDALAGGIGDGDGGLRDGERHGDGGRGLQREERNAELRAGRDVEDHRGAGARRRA